MSHDVGLVNAWESADPSISSCLHHHSSEGRTATHCPAYITRPTQLPPPPHLHSASICKTLSGRFVPRASRARHNGRPVVSAHSPLIIGAKSEPKGSQTSRPALNINPPAALAHPRCSLLASAVSLHAYIHLCVALLDLYSSALCRSASILADLKRHTCAAPLPTLSTTAAAQTLFLPETLATSLRKVSRGVVLSSFIGILSVD